VHPGRTLRSDGTVNRSLVVSPDHGPTLLDRAIRPSQAIFMVPLQGTVGCWRVDDPGLRLRLALG